MNTFSWICMFGVGIVCTLTGAITHMERDPISTDTLINYASDPRAGVYEVLVGFLMAGYGLWQLLSDPK